MLQARSASVPQPLAMNRLNMIAQQLAPAPAAGAAFLHTMIRVVKL